MDKKRKSISLTSRLLHHTIGVRCRNMMDFISMGKLLAEQRRKSRYTQEMVAEIVGVTDKTIRNIEYGITAADIETVLKLWDLYSLPENALFVYYARDKEMETAIEFFEKRLEFKRITVHV